MRWLLPSLILFSACAHDSVRKVWLRKGATVEDFKRDEYECVRDSRTGWFSSGHGISGAIARARAKEDAQEQSDELFHMCMEAHGWLLEKWPPPDPAPYLPPPVEAVGPDGPYDPDAGFQPRKVE